MFALVDVNNMYVSCERVFRPVADRPSRRRAVQQRRLRHRAQQRGQGPRHRRWPSPGSRCATSSATAGLIALSANFELYGDMSSRMMTLAARYAPRQEIYSIDECFLDFDGVRGDLVGIGRDLRATVLQWTGLPTSVGFGADQDAGQAGQPRGQDGRPQARELSGRAGAGVRLRRDVAPRARRGDAARPTSATSGASAGRPARA